MRVVLVVTINGNAESLIDGVATNVEMQPGEGGVGKLVVKGKDLSALMDIIDSPALPFPAMPPSVRVLLILAKYAAFGVVPLVIPSIVDDPAAADRSRSRSSAAPTTPTSSRSRERCGLRVLPRAGPESGHVEGLLGPRDPRRRAAAGADHRHGRAEQRRAAARSTSTRRSKTDPDRLLPGAADQGADRHSDSGHHAAQPAARPGAAAAAEDRAPRRHRPPVARSALMAGLAYAGQHSDSVFGNGQLDVARYGRLLKSRQLVGVRGAGLPFDGLYYVKSVTHDIERGAYKQSFTLARNGLISTLPTVPA